MPLLRGGPLVGADEEDASEDGSETRKEAQTSATRNLRANKTREGIKTGSIHRRLPVVATTRKKTRQAGDGSTGFAIPARPLTPPAWPLAAPRASVICGGWVTTGLVIFRGVGAWQGAMREAHATPDGGRRQSRLVREPKAERR